MKIFVDGHLNGLNGIMGQYASSGYALLTREDGKQKRIDIKKQKLTNNEAELLSIFFGCLYAKSGDEVISDSQAMLSISKLGKSKEPRFQLLVITINHLIKVKNLKLSWIEREKNLST